MPRLPSTPAPSGRTAHTSATARDDAAPRRQRLAPAERASQILDVAARLLMDEGFTEVSMERLGRDAGISKALVYNYFPNRTDLLAALLEREIGVLRASQSAAVKAAVDFKDLVRRTTRIYIEHMQLRGALLQKLWAEPAVARTLAADNQRGRDQAMNYLVKLVAREYGLPPDVALPAVDMQMAMTEAAAQHLAKAHNDVDFATELCVTLLLGGLDALARQHARAAAKAARAVKAAKATKASKSAKSTKAGKAARAVKTVKAAAHR
jgi:TetR/AcrR family transcriptional regulator, fatty acid biosynthesis regulator